MCQHCQYLPTQPIESIKVTGEPHTKDYRLEVKTQGSIGIYQLFIGRSRCQHYRDSLFNIRLAFGYVDGDYDPSNGDCVLLTGCYYDMSRQYWQQNFHDELIHMFLRNKPSE